MWSFGIGVYDNGGVGLIARCVLQGKRQRFYAGGRLIFVVDGVVFGRIYSNVDYIGLCSGRLAPPAAG